MSESILEYLELAGGVINLFAVLVIIAGFAMAAGGYALRFRVLALKQNFSRFKIELGSALTLALEILILADVIETITAEPTFHSLSVLALLIVLRTIVSWTLVLETEGHWPWQSSGEDDLEQAHA
jgi:uncharacterized membrane protein